MPNTFGTSGGVAARFQASPEQAGNGLRRFLGAIASPLRTFHAKRLERDRAVAVEAFQAALRAGDTRRQRAAYVEAVAATMAALRAEVSR